MATDVAMWTRRRCLSALGSASVTAFAAPAIAAALTTGPHHVAAAWDDAAGRHHVGILSVSQQGQVHIQTSITVPTRAHGLLLEPGGSVLAVARRPGDWLLRWHPRQQSGHAAVAQWHWLEADNRLNGHAVSAADGSAVWTTETDRESGQGLLVRRNGATLAATDHWPTQGLDPHAMVWLPDGNLLVANGGIAARPETGRAKVDTAPMASSLVLMSPADGTVLRSWRVMDPWLSLRHVAWHSSGTVAVAMQAQHADAQERARAPVLGLLNMQLSTWTLVAGVDGADGYGGDVAVIGDQCYVSCPRADRVLRVSPDGSRASAITLPDACALAGVPDGSWGWASGKDAAWRPGVGEGQALALDIAPDNHAVVL